MNILKSIRVFFLYLPKLFVVLMPWQIKRVLLISFFGYELDRKAYIGISWIFPDYLCMKEGAFIGNFNVAIHLEKVVLLEKSKIGRLNWITGYSKKGGRHFLNNFNRCPAFFLGRHSAITKKHHFDCTDKISIGDYSIIGGYNSFFLTHFINIEENCQDCEEISIGSYCYIANGVTVTAGALLPDFSVLGTMSLLNRKFSEKYSLFVGIPARKRKELSPDSGYFNRESGFVV